MRRRTPLWTLLALVAAGFASTALACTGPKPNLEAAPDGRTDADWTNLVGWYRFDDGRNVLLTWSADGGLRLVGLREPFFSWTFEPMPNRLFDWTPASGQPRIVRFRFDDNGQALGFNWTAAENRLGSTHRLPSQPYTLQELEFLNQDVQLSGTLLIPLEGEPVPAAVMIHGSGSSDRDNLWYLVIADFLARNGIAVLLPDKRGCGKSTGEWQTSSMDDFAGDAHAAVEAVRRLRGINPDQVGLLGISQGGRVAPLTAARLKVVAFAINISGGTLPVDQSLLHESRQTLRQKGMPGWMADGFGPFAAAIAKRRHPVWWKKNGKFDPLPYWRKLTVPALIVYGADDEHDNVPVHRSMELLEEIRTSVDLTIQLYRDSGHGLFLPGTQTIRPEFLEFLAGWIHEKI